MTNLNMMKAKNAPKNQSDVFRFIEKFNKLYNRKNNSFLTRLIYNVLHVCPLRPTNMNDKIEIVTNTNSEDHEVHEGHKNHVIFGIFLDFRFSFCIKSSV